MYLDSLLNYFPGKFTSSMKVIRHAGFDSGVIILDDQTRQQMTRRITGFFRHTAVYLTKPAMGETLH